MNFFMTHTTTEKKWSELPPKHKKWLAYCNWMKIPENPGLVVVCSEQDTGRPNYNYNHSNVWSHLNIFVWQVHLKLNWQTRLMSDFFFLILVDFWYNANFISCGTCQSKIVTFAHLGDSNSQIQGVPPISTHFWFQILTFLIVLSKKARFAILTQMV